jgi:GDPmannose 4,6-dehydratase
MLQADEPRDYLIASGVTTSLREFVNCAFEVAGLSVADHLQSLDLYRRPADIDYSALDPSLIREELGWSSSRSIREIVEKMYRGELL